MQPTTSDHPAVCGQTPSTSPRLHEITDHHVQSLIVTMAESLRYPPDLATVDRRASYLHDLAHRASTPGRAPYAATLPIAAVAGLLLDARRLAEAHPYDWSWVNRMFTGLGIEPSVLLPDAALLPGDRGTGIYGAPVAQFNPDPSAYNLHPVEDLPFSHSLKACVFKEQLEAEIVENKRRNAKRRWMPWRGAPEDSVAAAGRWVWLNYQSQQPERCQEHPKTSAEDFRQAVRDAADLVATVRPWHRQSIYASHILPRSGGEPLDPKTSLMWSLIADPVTWKPGDARVGNGQHRICRARVAGCTHLLVSAT